MLYLCSIYYFMAKKYNRECKANYSMHIPPRLKELFREKVERTYGADRHMSIVILRLMYEYVNHK